MRANSHSSISGSPPGAFTLLEMVIVLTIIALLIGLSIMSFEGVTRSQDLRRPVSELQRMTQEAVQRAGIYERPQIIVFDARGFAMRYRTDANGRFSSEDTALWLRRVELPPNMKLSLRRFGAQKFSPAAGQRLVVAPGGLCEPLSARFELGDGWIEIALDPLSGGVREEAMNIP